MSKATPQGFSDYVVYVDESGDHGLKSMDKSYPMFVLAFCVFNKQQYANVITPKLQEFKFLYFGHDMVVLHEHEIRKPKGPFIILANPDTRQRFIDDLNTIIIEAEFKIIATAIRKDQFIKKHGDSENLYNVAVRSCLKRLFYFLDEHGQSSCVTHTIFEQRGEQEDKDLELEFRRVCDEENPNGVPLPFSIVLASKQRNSCGLQLADLVARPIGRKCLNPGQDNRAYDILEKKFLEKLPGKKGAGLESYP